MRIRAKFLLLFFVCSFLPLVFLAYVNFHFAQQVLLKDTQDKLQLIAKFQALRVDEGVDLYKLRIDSLSSQTPRLDALTRFNATKDPALQEQMSRSLLETQQIIPDIETMSLMDTRGEIVASTNSLLIGKKQDISFFVPSDTKIVSVLDFLVHPDAVPHIRLRKQIVKDGISLGAMEILLKNDFLPAILNDYTDIGLTGEIELAKIAKDGSVFFIIPRRFEKNSTLLIIEALKKHGGFFSQSIDHRGNSVVAAAKYIPDLDWVLLVKIDESEALLPVNGLRDVIVIFSFIFVLSVVMMTLFFVHSLTAPILRLVSVAKRVQTGDFSVRATVGTRDEVGELATSFNSMEDALEESRGILEKKVIERTTQLEIANKDLESFTYSVSHDLRAPLRSIDGFSKILEEDYLPKFDDAGKHVIATIRASTKQMGNLVDDLLSFSRLGRQAIKPVDVDMTAFATAAFDQLHDANPGRTFQFTCSELPHIHADSLLMRQVWVNLLSNAVKFTRKKDVAMITVGSREEDGNIIYFIQDNGVGFDMKYVDKLFLVFQRLHSAEDFEGTGIGLSIVARIIQKHGGRVWAEGAVDQGATFSFSLPSLNKN